MALIGEEQPGDLGVLKCKLERRDLQQPKPPCFIASNLFVFGVNVGLERFVKRLFDTITNTSPVQLSSSDQLCPGTRNRFRSSALEL